jgi:PAS domain S-box-containing protein
MCYAKSDGKFVKINKAFNQTLGWSTDELPVTRFLRFVHPDDVDFTTRIMDKLDNGEIITNFYNRYRHKVGHYIHIQWNAVYNKEMKMYNAIGRDASQLKVESEVLLKILRTKRLFGIDSS